MLEIIVIDLLWGDIMKGSVAVKQRILNLAKEKNMSINKICTNGGITTSTVNTMLNNCSEYCSVKTIIKICQGLGISLYDFFNDDSFKDLEEEND